MACNHTTPTKRWREAQKDPTLPFRMCNECYWSKYLPWRRQVSRGDYGQDLLKSLTPLDEDGRAIAYLVHNQGVHQAQLAEQQERTVLRSQAQQPEQAEQAILSSSSLTATSIWQ